MSIKTFTLADLAEHKTKKSLYLAIEGKVYNCTDFIDEHPGGEEVLFDVAGVDATEAFEDVGHSEEARALLKGMLVGDLEGSAKPTKAPVASATPKAAVAKQSSDSGRLVSWVKGFF
ncbi:hypothetical protein BGX34_004820 [Mortierella sp. NVP85]|nr:hypothetical protein BGX34_004820 [Mortierella sp. NVP85]